MLYRIKCYTTQSFDIYMLDGLSIFPILEGLLLDSWVDVDVVRSVLFFIR